MSKAYYSITDPFTGIKSDKMMVWEGDAVSFRNSDVDMVSIPNGVEKPKTELTHLLRGDRKEVSNGVCEFNKPTK